MITGVWPLIDRRTFEALTGPKGDFWLARTVGALAASVGSTLLLASIRRRVSPELEWLALSSAAGFAAVDVVYVARGRISKVYLADAVAQASLISVWRAAARRSDD